MNAKRDLNSVYAWARDVAIAASSSSSSHRDTRRKRKATLLRSQGAEDAGDECFSPRIKFQISKEIEEKKAKEDVGPHSSPRSPADQSGGQEERGRRKDGGNGDETAMEEEEDEEEVWNIPSDTDAALMMIHAQFPEIKRALIRPFVLLSQLYSTVKDRTLVDRELEILKQQNTVRVFKLSSGQDDYAIMYLSDYIAQIDLGQKTVEGKHAESDTMIFDWYRDHVLSTYIDVGITQAHFESLLAKVGCRVQENHISLLIKAGLLVRQLADQNSYWFAIPNIGFILKNLAQGRKEIYSLLNRRQYKGLLLSSLEKKKLRTSQLGMRFHIRDLLGSGKLCLANTPSGLLVSVPRD